MGHTPSKISRRYLLSRTSSWRSMNSVSFGSHPETLRTAEVYGQVDARRAGRTAEAQRFWAVSQRTAAERPIAVERLQVGQELLTRVLQEGSVGSQPLQPLGRQRNHVL